MNANFGLFPELELVDGRGKRIKGKLRRKAVALRARADFADWIHGGGSALSAAK